MCSVFCQTFYIYMRELFNRSGDFFKKHKMIFFQNFFYAFKHCIVWYWFTPKIILISPRY